MPTLEVGTLPFSPRGDVSRSQGHTGPSWRDPALIAALEATGAVYNFAVAGNRSWATENNGYYSALCVEITNDEGSDTVRSLTISTNTSENLHLKAAAGETAGILLYNLNHDDSGKRFNDFTITVDQANTSVYVGWAEEASA